MTNDLLWSMENKNYTALVGVDLSAAFNKVDHSILIEVMNINFEVNGTALKWLELYCNKYNNVFAPGTLGSQPDTYLVPLNCMLGLGVWHIDAI